MTSRKTGSGSYSVLTWNISHARASQEAPDEWTDEDTMNHLLDLIEKANPEFVALQEIPSEDFCIHLSPTHGHAPPVQTHSGYTTLFFQHWMVPDDLLGTHVGPIIFFEDPAVIVGSLHLPPYSENAEKRFDIMNGVVNRLLQRPAVLAGDMNMRKEESHRVEQLGLDDLWRLAGSPPENRFTFDTFTNNYHGNDMRIHARFDRVYGRDIVIKSFDLFGNKPQKGGFYLSDHFGILVDIQV